MEHQHHEHSHEEPKEPVAVISAKQKDRFLPASILIAAVIIAGAVVFAATRPSGGGIITLPIATTTAGSAGTAAAPVPPIGSGEAILGNANAPVAFIEYGDYQCPFCGRFFSQVEPSLRTDYINTGKVKMVFRNFQFLGPESTAAGAAAYCAADQNKFWAYRDALYQAKVNEVANNGGSENDGFFSRSLFLKLANQTGLDTATFTSCIDGNKYASKVEKDKADASAVGVNSTPTNYINGQQVLGAQPYTAFKAVIDAALQGK